MDVPQELTLAPEFILENIHHFLKLENFPALYGKYTDRVFTADFQNNVLQLYIFLMQAHFIKNPHTKAKFAEGISLLLPVQSRENVSRSAALLQPSSEVSLLQPQILEETNYLFASISCKKDVIISLLHVYVSFEVAGEALQYEQKFHYRYPINYVLMYFLTINEYREIISTIAKEAHENMTNQKPPIFLRLVDGILNDGTWLLEESLLKMKGIRQAEEEIASLNFKLKKTEEKQQVLEDLKASKKTSTSLNLLAADVLRILESLSKLTSKVFTHPDMTDKLAAMLNYFLGSLTGKDRKQFKVLEPARVSFYPLQLLKSLKHIYCSFAFEDAFVKAISQDGRSYHPNLFDETQRILGRSENVEDLIDLGKSVLDKREEAADENKFYEDAPEEFFDPVMSTIMRDPVILPSSKKTVDRSTIAKHLLSNETDPYTRQPLSLDMVKPDIELKKKITNWEKQKRGITIEVNLDNKTETIEKRKLQESLCDSKNIKKTVDDEENSGTGSKDQEKEFKGGHSLGGGKSFQRIRKDLFEIQKEQPTGIFVCPEDSDMTLLHAIIRGPDDTPYAGGYFYFQLRFPPNYPASPPKVQIMTTDGGRVRFNPNLYRNGKVCLSILGTWEGPGWTPVIDLLQVFI